MPNAVYDTLLARFPQHLNTQSFKAFGQDCPGADLSFHHRAVSFTKFALLDTFITVRFMGEEHLSPESVQAFSSESFSFAVAHKNWLPRGLFGYAAAFPLVIAPRVNDEVSNFLNVDYCPKHWASMEFPTVLDQETGKLHFFRATPMWGAAYFKGMRKQAERYFGEV
jgi:hypothetical protein